MHKIGFAISLSLYSNDHQVRILIDGEDWLGDSSLGIDPPEFFAQSALSKDGKLLVGRCECGCVGCDDATVHVARDRNEVTWTAVDNSALRFSTIQYDLAVDQAKNDFAWETPNRTAERLAASELGGLVLADGFSFQWASTRIRDRILSLSFTRDSVQKIVDLSWDGVRPETARISASSFLRQLTEQSHAPKPAS